MSLFSRLVVALMPLVPKAAVGFVAKRYVAGETLEDAIRCVRQLNSEGAMATIDVLGEEVLERKKAASFVEHYMQVFEAIKTEKLEANVSIKPSMLGHKIDTAFCSENIGKIISTARDYNNFVRIDMEDHTMTDQTVTYYNETFKKYGHCGIVFQSYLRRTIQDINNLPEEGANVRLCKGIYIEPRTVAWKAYETVRANYLYCLEKLFKRGIYTGIATHDEHLVWGAMSLIDKYKLKPEQYEFQMLLGVDESLRKIIIDNGHRLRVYVPFGVDWYPYSTRRLRENPDVAIHIIRAFLGLGPK